MRHISKSLSLLLIISLIFCGIPSVFAEQRGNQDKVDYSTYDWESLDFSKIDSTTWASMREWLLTSQNLDIIFLLARNADGYYKNDICSIISVHFKSHPSAVLYTMAQEDEADWKHYGQFIIREQPDWEATVELLESIKLTGADAQKGCEILAYMIDYAENLYRMEIHNPNTGDSVGVFVALLAISGLLGCTLLTQRKRFI